jgi:uncharacterized membrane protein
MARSRYDYAIIILALVGALLAAYAFSLHLAPSDSSFCNVTANINCDKVNKSVYANVLGVPVALLGLLAYVAIALLILKRRSLQSLLSFTDRDMAQYLLGLITAMLAFQLYLTGIEIFVLRAYCIVCLASQAVMIAIMWCAWKEHGEALRRRRV